MEWAGLNKRAAVRSVGGVFLEGTLTEEDPNAAQVERHGLSAEDASLAVEMTEAGTEAQRPWHLVVQGRCGFG